ncbi:hypothetical protein FHR92_003048 [Fontibacillus solani]|uniref:Uncharacterized protein n=1 Tax=Fontibacillus solani TaxID=1572857 RepID=A0A7W3XSH0_9BACL|nr:hypothetical protein [Fontibacillus solani]MBA9086568.1 hypothetical protein [Fontibacillus solani]
MSWGIRFSNDFKEVEITKLDNPKLWDDQEWVDGAMEKLEQYRNAL